MTRITNGRRQKSVVWYASNSNTSLISNKLEAWVTLQPSLLVVQQNVLTYVRTVLGDALLCFPVLITLRYVTDGVPLYTTTTTTTVPPRMCIYRYSIQKMTGSTVLMKHTYQKTVMKTIPKLIAT